MDNKMKIIIDELKSAREANKRIERLLDAAMTVISESNELIKGLSGEVRVTLTFNEATEYLGVSKSSLYKQTSSGNIPHYKPNGKNIYFKRDELDDWIVGGLND